MRKLALGLALIAPSFAHAHDTWTNGKPVPEWVKHQCCGEAEAHRVPSSAVHYRPDGIHVDGYPHVIPHYRELPTPDGDQDYWLFYPAHDPGTLRCFFGPRKGT
jgi:hypothetical protein